MNIEHSISRQQSPLQAARSPEFSAALDNARDRDETGTVAPPLWSPDGLDKRNGPRESELVSHVRKVMSGRCLWSGFRGGTWRRPARSRPRKLSWRRAKMRRTSGPRSPAWAPRIHGSTEFRLKAGLRAPDARSTPAHWPRTIRSILARRSRTGASKPSPRLRQKPRPGSSRP